MGRRNARKLAFYLLFQYDFVKDNSYDEVKEIFFNVNGDIDDTAKEYILEKTDGVLEHLDEIDEMVGAYAKGWTVDRLAKVDKAILRLALYEIKFSSDTPQGVAINEAVELAKTYSSDEAPVFINGILGKIVSSENNVES